MTNSGIGIIRISGDEALDIIEKVFKPKKKDKKIKDVKTYTAHYGHVYDGSTLLDECIVLVMKDLILIQQKMLLRLTATVVWLL